MWTVLSIGALGSAAAVGFPVGVPWWKAELVAVAVMRCPPRPWGLPDGFAPSGASFGGGVATGGRSVAEQGSVASSWPVAVRRFVHPALPASDSAVANSRALATTWARSIIGQA